MRKTHRDKPLVLTEQKETKEKFATYFEDSSKLAEQAYKEEERRESYLSFNISS